MPTIETNKGIWDGSYDWMGEGEEWSTGWNGSESQWFFSLYPRIHSFLPAKKVVEIAPGFGRWTAYLLPHCGSYVGFDLAAKCVDSCRARFGGMPDVSFEVTDGVSFPGIADKSVDFIFSFDSLVHTEMDIIEGYLKTFSRTLTPDGVAFIHHSNAEPWRELLTAMDSALKGFDGFVGPEARPHIMRSNLCGLSVSADIIQKAAEKYGLRCWSQEIIDWNSPLPQNCISSICRQGSKWDRPTKRYRDIRFMDEMRHIHQLAKLYSRRRLTDD